VPQPTTLLRHLHVVFRIKKLRQVKQASKANENERQLSEDNKQMPKCKRTQHCTVMEIKIFYQFTDVHRYWSFLFDDFG
jgi:hypothetical protein